MDVITALEELTTELEVLKTEHEQLVVHSTVRIKELQDELEGEGLEKEEKEKLKQEIEHITATTQLSLDMNQQKISLITRLEEKEKEHQWILAMKDKELERLHHQLHLQQNMEHHLQEEMNPQEVVNLDYSNIQIKMLHA